jgi:hypothetical protein
MVTGYRTYLKNYLSLKVLNVLKKVQSFLTVRDQNQNKKVIIFSYS